MNNKLEKVIFFYKGKEITIKGFSNDYIFNKIKKTKNFYEIELLRYIKIILKNPKNILDIGANIGNHSVFFSQICSEKVISFEPNKEAFKILLENLDKNSDNNNFIAENLGVSLKKETKNLYIIEEENVGMARIIEDKELVKLNNKESFKINLIDLDTYLNSYPNLNISAIKVDVEGYEFQVLKGAKNIIEKYKPEIFIEISNASKYNKDFFDKYLINLGYKPVSVWGYTPMWHYSAQNKINMLKFKTISFLLKLSQKFN